MTPVEAAVSNCLIRLLSPEDGVTGVIDLDADLFERYGLTSLNMVLLMTSLCEETNTDLTLFTDQDIARLRTPRHVAGLIETAGRSALTTTEA